MSAYRLKRPLIEPNENVPNKRFNAWSPTPTKSNSSFTISKITSSTPLRTPLRFPIPSCTLSSTSPSSSTNLNRMKVHVRVRPLNAREQIGERKVVIDVVDEQMMVFDPKVDDQEYYYHGRRYKEIGSKPNKNLQFVFDRVFDEDNTNLQVYEETTKSFVDSLLNGFNCTVFAYGATGSGKTYTMLGSSDDPGVIYYTAMHLFQKIQENQDERLEVSVSYLEIYNENVYDLLRPSNPKRTLIVCEDSQKGVVVRNLSTHKPRDANEILDLLSAGNRNRTQHPTDANAESSRSHAIFQIILKKQGFNSNEMSVQLSKMSLIDLAGSERATVANRSKRTKVLHREGGNINKSLLVLGNCITALSNKNPRQKNSYIPYRGSKLTFLLRDSLGGNCQTAMIATVSPSSIHYEETHNTLVYADRAKGIQLNLKRNSFSVDIQPRHYNALIDDLNKKNIEQSEQIILLQAEVQKLRNQLEKAPIQPIKASNSSIELLNSVKNALELLFEERLELRRQLMECESNLKKVDLRLIFRKLDAERYRIMVNDQKDGAISKNDPSLALRNQKLHYIHQKESLEKAVAENEEKIQRYETDLKTQTSPDDWSIDTYFQNHNMITEFKDKSIAERHAVEIAKELFMRLDSSEEIMSESVKLIRHVYHLLNGMKRLSEELEGSFTSLLRKVEGKKNVVWKDDVSSPSLIKHRALEDIFILPTYNALPKTPIANNTTRSLVSVHSITP